MNGKIIYSEDDLKRSQFSVVVIDAGKSFSLKRCRFILSKGKVNCDEYTRDKKVLTRVRSLPPSASKKILSSGVTLVPVDESIADLERRKGLLEGEPNRTQVGHIAKYYYFDGQFGVQIFSGLSFIENKGRGDIAFGKCRKTLNFPLRRFTNPSPSLYPKPIP